MALQLNNAPLVELVAELRWSPTLASATDQSGAPVMIPQSLLDPGQSELLFQRFGASIYQHGFKIIERLIPPGMPLIPDQMCYRYRLEPGSQPVLAQIGASQFSVNALPPYKSWDEFRPWVGKAISALLEARPGGQPFKVSLRYIDAFNGTHRQGQGPSEFLENTLGMGIRLPSAIANRQRGDAQMKSSFTTVVPLDGMHMTVKAGEGVVNGEIAAILDTVVAVDSEVAAEVDALLIALDGARKVIHETFMELVAPIIDRFKSNQGGPHV